MQPIKTQVTQVSGQTAICEGIGIVIIKIPKTDVILPLYPAYFAPEFPQNTISPNAIKHYNKYRSVWSEALEWIRMVSHVGQKIHVRIDPVQIGNELLDYFKVNIMMIDTSQTENNTTDDVPSFNHSTAPVIPETILKDSKNPYVRRFTIPSVKTWILSTTYYYIED